MEDVYTLDLIKRLKEKGINMLAVDFDQTMIDIHTGGRWTGTSEELCSHVRPVFNSLVPLAMQHGIHVAIVTFSPQTRVIANVLKTAFTEALASKIPIRGNDGKWEYKGGGSQDGKQAHIATVAMELSSKHNIDITRDTTLLIDDDRTNIEVALRERVRAVWFNPQQPEDFVNNSLQLLQ